MAQFLANLAKSKNRLHDAGVPGNLAPPKYGPPGPNFLGNMPPPGAIFPRKFGPPFGNLAPLYKHGC